MGRTVRLGASTATIVGIVAPGFRGLSLGGAPDVFVPLHAIADVTDVPMNYFAETNHVSSPTAGVQIIGRLRDAITPAQAAGRLDSLPATVPGLERAGTQIRLGLTPLDVAARTGATKAGLVTFARLLAATVSLTLLVGCGTVALLLFVRIEARRAELATCLALGASATRLVRGLALEAAVVAGAAALAAVPASWALLRALRAFELPGGVSVGMLDAGIDARAIAVALAAAVVAVGIVTAVTSVHAFTRTATGEVLRPAGLTRRPSGRYLRDALLATQVASALLLMGSATVFLRSLQAALALNPQVGMQTVLQSSLDLEAYGYDAGRAAAFFDRWRTRLASHPAVSALAYSVDEGGMGPRGTLAVNGTRRSFPSIVRFVAVEPDYFVTLRLPLSSGRGFVASDGARAPLVGVASASLARQLAGGGSAIGQRVTLPMTSPGAPSPDVTVVGVVPDVIVDVEALQPLTLYLHLAQRETSTYRSLVLRVDGDGDAVKRQLLEVSRQIDPAVIPPGFGTLRERIEGQMGPQRLGSAVLGVLGIVALFLAALSTYVLADALATFRTRELGIRAALGATGSGLARLLLAETLRPVCLGVALGLALAASGAHLLRAFVFQVQPLDVPTLAAVAGLLLAVVVASSLRPVRRAVRLDVARILREL